MERTKHSGSALRWLIILLIATPWTIQGQTPKPEDYRCRIYVYLQNGNMKAWANILDEMHAANQKAGSPGLLMELTRAQYGFLAFSLGKTPEDETEKKAYREKGKVVLDRALENIESLRKSYKPLAEVLALESALTAFRIGFSPIMAPVWGPKAAKLIAEAESKAPGNPFVLLEKANAKNFAPSFAGGNPTEAVTIYQQAAKAFENDKKTYCNWVYLIALTNQGQCLTRLNRKKEAKTVYEKIVKITPGFLWVKDELLPGVLNH
jgi:tetratricopeptide (TPR) repeat protein